MNTGKGTLGQLAKNDSVYKNLDKALVSTNELVTAVRQDPCLLYTSASFSREKSWLWMMREPELAEVSPPST